MKPDPGAPAKSCWTLMMADVVALMLAFFVLSFSMREMVEVDRTSIGGHAAAATAGHGVAIGGPAAAPGPGVPLALAPHEGHSTDQLQAPERPATDAPSLAYLAAILQGDGGEASPARVRHDDTMVVVELPNLPDDDGPLGDGARRPLLALAFLARRFDLDLTVAMPAVHDDSLAARVARALRLRERMAEAVGFAALAEVTFVAADLAVAAGAAAPPAAAALLVKVKEDAAAGHSPR